MTETRKDQFERGLLDKFDASPYDRRSYTLVERMARYRVPGVSIAVFSGGQIEWAQGYGVRVSGEAGAVDADTLFQAASISKPVAALALLRLFEDRGLDVDTDVNQYLTSWQVPSVDGWQPRVTLRQLFSHSAGMTVSGFPGYQQGEAVPSLLQILDGLPPTNTEPIRVDTLPGTQFRYAGGGTSIAQQIACDLTGQPFPEFMREWALDPLGMARSRYDQPLAPEYHANAAVAHTYTGAPIAGNWHTYPELAAAGMWTTPSDVARFAIALQAAYQGKSSLVSKQVADWMLTEVVQADGYSLGMGPFIHRFANSAYFEHTGGNVGYKNDFRAYFEGSDQGAAVMTNGDQGGELFEEIMVSLASAYGWRDLLPSTSAAPDADYSGTYRLGNLMITVASNGAQWTFQPNGQNPLTLRPLPTGGFGVEPIKAAIRFTQNATGRVTGFTFTQNGKELQATRTD